MVRSSRMNWRNKEPLWWPVLKTGQTRPSGLDAHASPESDAVLDFGGCGLRFWVIPRGVFVLHAADADMVVVGSSLPRTNGSVLARPEEFRLNGIGWEVLVALNNNSRVAFSDDFAAPGCFRHFVGLQRRSAALEQDIAGPVNLSKALDAGKATRLLQFSRTWRKKNGPTEFCKSRKICSRVSFFCSPRTCC